MAKKKKSKRRKGKGRPSNQMNRSGSVDVISSEVSMGQQPESEGENSALTADEQPDQAVRLQPFGEGPRFTVLMAAYNRADLIGTAIQSVLQQDFDDYELVIVDDGSTDHTPQVVRGFKDARIRYFRKEQNEGRSPTRNRAIAEARGEYVLWMADDDLLMPGVLRLYHETLTAEPHIDIIYGNLQLFDHDSGQDLNIFEPNDWTGKDRAIVGAKLYGSCVPDGGTANRRTLYSQVGPGPYDDEFVRAQDYELWTRIVGQARFRKVDATVYRYRKHAGGTSWGEFIDLSLDSKIIRRHLARHPMPVLFPQFDWSYPEWATVLAYIRIAKNLRMYGDHHNALRFLNAIPGVECHSEAFGVKVEALISLGQLDDADQLLSDDAFSQLRPTELKEKLQRLVSDAKALMSFAVTARQDHQFIELGQRAQAFMAEHEQSYHAVLYRGHAEAGLGQLEKAMHNFCLAARINPNDTEARQALVPLLKRFGPQPKTDIDAMRRRTFESFVELPVHHRIESKQTAGVSVVIWDDENEVHSEASSRRRMCLLSVLSQSVEGLELILKDDDVNRSTVALGQSKRESLGVPAAHLKWLTPRPGDNPWTWYTRAFDAATSDYITTLELNTMMYPGHLTHSIALLEGGADVVMCTGHLLQFDDVESADVQTSFYLPDAAYQDGPCQVRPHLSLSMFVMRRDVDGLPSPSAMRSPLPEWAYAVRLRKYRGLVRTARPGVGRPVAEPSEESKADLIKLAQLYGQLGNDSAFDPVVREGQNARLASLGFTQATQGRSTIVILITETGDALRKCLIALDESTWAPYDFVFIAADRAMVIPPWLTETIEARDDIRFSRAPQGASVAKLINVGLSQANGEFVCVMTTMMALLPGWLGRIQWALTQPPSVGIVMPTIVDSAHSPQWIKTGEDAWAAGPVAPITVDELDPQCFVCTRALLDTIGGFDTTCHQHEDVFAQFVMRAEHAGFQICRAPDVHMAHVGMLPSELLGEWPTDGQSERPNQRVSAENLYCPPGAEEGYRPDVHPLDVLEASDINCLIYPPWTSQTQMNRFFEGVCDLPAGILLWLRVEPGDGPEKQRWIETWCAQHQRIISVDILLVDAHLASEREGALFVRAGCIWTDDDWADAKLTIRRAHDCGTRVLRGMKALHDWVHSSNDVGESSS